MAIATGTALVIGAGISAATNIAGGIISGAATAEQRKKVEQASQKALEQIEALGAGPDLAKEIMLKEYKSAGIYTPKLEQTITQGFSKAADLKERDPSTRDAQVDALSAFQELGRTGLSQADKAAMNQLKREVETANRGRLESIRQNMAQRGMGGAGAELATSLQQSQAATNDMSASADRLAQQAQQARIAALQQQAGISSQLRGQDYNIDMDKARAADELNRFNTLQQTQTQQRNIASENQGQMYNLSNDQRLLDMNTGQSNQELMRQRQAQQQMRDDQIRVAQAKSDALTGNAQTQQKAAQQQAQNIQSVFSGIGQAATAAGGYLANQKPTRSKLADGYDSLTDDEKLEADKAMYGYRS